MILCDGDTAAYAKLFRAAVTAFVADPAEARADVHNADRVDILEFCRIFRQRSRSRIGLSRRERRAWRRLTAVDKRPTFKFNRWDKCPSIGFDRHMTPTESVVKD